MAGKLTDELQSLVQRSGTNTGRMRTESERAAFADNVRKDIAAIVYQLNTVYKTLVEVMSSAQDLNALDYGLSGNVVYTHIRATAADAEAYWTEELSRARTIKETIDVLLAEIARLENEIQQALDSDEYDDTELRSLIQGNSLDLKQLAHDTMGSGYTLDGDGLPNLSYSVSQALDAIGAFFSGYPGSGNTYVTSYPALSLSVLLSEITIDTTLDQTVITGLPTDLAAIRTFIGMDDASDSTPDYSTYGGSLVDVADGDSLEEAIWKLDQRAMVSTLQAAYTGGGAGTAGNIQLTNPKGEVRILDDAGTPLGVVLRWIDGTSTEKGHLSDTGMVLSNNAFLQIASNASDPINMAGAGRFNARPDATSAKVEAYYKNSSVADPNTQITRNGIVKELEVGHSVLLANNWHKKGAATGPLLVLTEFTDNVVQTLDYDNTEQENAYCQLPIPLCEDGTRPTRLKLVGYWVIKDILPAAYAGGTGFAIAMHNSDNGSHTTISDRVLLTNTWSTPGVVVKAVSTTDRDKLLVLEHGTITLASNTLGLVNLKMSRYTADGADNYGNNVGCVCVHAIWYR